VKHLFSFQGRLNRQEFAKIGIPTAIFNLIAFSSGSVAEANGEPAPFLQILALVGYVIYAAACCRRLRDTGASSTALFIYTAINTVFGTISWVWLSLMKSWDDQNFAGHILALMKHMSRADGKDRATPQEVQAFAEIGQNAMGMPPQLLERAVSDFSTGRPSQTVKFHAQKLKQDKSVTSAMLEDATRMLMAVAGANGQPTPESLVLFDEALKEFGVAAPLPPGIPEVLGLAAKLAKADGRVTKAEVDTVDQFLRYGLGLSGAIRGEAISVFKKAKDDAQSYQSYANRCGQALMGELEKEHAARVAGGRVCR